MIGETVRAGKLGYVGLARGQIAEHRPYSHLVPVRRNRSTRDPAKNSAEMMRRRAHEPGQLGEIGGQISIRQRFLNASCESAMSYLR
jgi:hypothetical protein